MKKVEKNAKVSPKSSDTDKEVVKSRAALLDEIILSGGTWEELTAKANAASANLNTKVKAYPKALLLTHIRYRQAKRKNYFAGVEITDDGIAVKK